MRKHLVWLVVVLAGCPDVGTDTNDNAVPYVEFDPGNSIIPFPNNLLLDPTTGKVNLPVQACDSPATAATKTGVLNKLDGFGTFEVGMQFTLSEPADASTLTSANLLLYKRAQSGTPLTTLGQPVPIVAFPGKTLRFDAANCTSPATVDAVTVVPRIPLDPNSTYTLVVLDGVKPAAGGDFHASFVWGLVRQTVDPVTLDANGNVVANRTPIPNPTSATDPNLAQLQGVDLLWKAHATALAFVDQSGQLGPNRSSVLVATDFNTQTTTRPLDPMVANSPASALGTHPLAGTLSIADARGASCSTGQGCAAFLTAVGVPCSSVPCAAVGDILAAGLVQGGSMYQQPTPNAFAASLPIPGPWTDPVNPMVQGPWQKTGTPPAGVLEVLAFIPNGTPPATGWPTVVFQHGLTRSKEDLFAIGAQLAAAGFASVAIDLQLHGSRAVPISNDPQLGCAGACVQNGSPTGTTCDTITPCPTTNPESTCITGANVSLTPPHAPQCYASVISTNLAASRDSLRQSVLDQMLLTNALKACGTTNCVAQNGHALAVDPAHIVYMGQSLGGIVGSISNSVSLDFKAAVLNVTGVGIADILETTPEQAFRASYVNGLIAAGVLVGTACSFTDPTVGLCANQDWTMQLGYEQFAGIERWVYDPADPANYASPHPNFGGLASHNFLQQEVVGDQVVPNPTSDNEGMLLGQTPATADPMTPADAQMTQPPPSAAIVATPLNRKWVRYPTLPPDAANNFPGNTFSHGSLLAPADATADGLLGTVRMQVDAITYLFLNK